MHAGSASRVQDGDSVLSLLRVGQPVPEPVRRCCPGCWATGLGFAMAVVSLILQLSACTWCRNDATSARRAAHVRGAHIRATHARTPILLTMNQAPPQRRDGRRKQDGGKQDGGKGTRLPSTSLFRARTHQDQRLGPTDGVELELLASHVRVGAKGRCPSMHHVTIDSTQSRPCTYQASRASLSRRASTPSHAASATCTSGPTKSPAAV